jgi:hypothetical protein
VEVVLAGFSVIQTLLLAWLATGPQRARRSGKDRRTR